MPIRALSAPPLLSPPPTNSRCQGLDLLVLAVLHLRGREKKDENNDDEEEETSSSIGIRKDEGVDHNEVGLKHHHRHHQQQQPTRRKRRPLAMPLKYQDSVLQPWKRRTRRRKSKVGEASF